MTDATQPSESDARSLVSIQNLGKRYVKYEDTPILLSSVFRMSQSAGRHMIEQGSGKIVSIASLLSFQGGITVPAYTASKSGVAGIQRDSLRNHARQRVICVVAQAPRGRVADLTAQLPGT